MKLKINDFTLATTFALIGLVATFGIIPSAFAMPGLGTSETPDPVVESAAITLLATSSAANAPHQDVSFRVYEPDLNPGFTSATGFLGVPPADCLSLFPVTAEGAGGRTVWELHRSGGAMVLAQFMIMDPGSVRVTFGNPTVSETVTLTNAVTTDGGSGGYKWVRIDGATQPDDSGSTASPLGDPPYRWAACGHEDVATSPDSFTGFVSDSIFNNKKPVGGMILPIDTTALVIAGIVTNAMWVLPALVAVAGASVVLLRFQVKRN